MNLALAIACVLFGLAVVAAPQASAAQQGTDQAMAVDPPARFERILWTSDLARHAAAAKAHGYSAVQLGRGSDPAPAIAQQLGYYLDQPVGKGVFELRDEQWKPLLRAYEQGRDPAVLVRPGCFATPGLIDGLARDAAAEALRVAGPGLRFIALADEPSATRHDAPLDTCRCSHCDAAFRTFVRARFATVDALNVALGSQFASFDDVVPLSTDQVRRAQLGDTVLPRNLRAFSLRQQFVDEQFAAAVHAVAASVQRAVPRVPVGLTGLQVPAAFGGSDYARLLPGLTLAEPYDPGAAALATSLLPAGAHRYSTLFAPAAETKAAQVPLVQMLKAQLAEMAAHGLAGVVVWNDALVFGPDGTVTPFGTAVDEAMRRLGPMLDACAGAVMERSSVWVLESQASVRAWWMLDSSRDGMTWVRRLSSHEATHSTSQGSRRSWVRLLQDLGLQPYFIGEAALPERLLQERPRCLVLPAAIALDDRTVQAITSYVRSGGTVLADHSAGLYDGELVLRSGGALDDVFGIEVRSLLWDDLLVREGRPVATARRQELPLAERGLQGHLGERRDGGHAFLENQLGKGRAVYLNAPVCDYERLRLDQTAVERAQDLRRRVRVVLERAGVVASCDVRGAGLPTCIERVRMRLRDGRIVLVVRCNALDDPLLLAGLARDGVRPVTIELPQERHLRLLGGEDLGTSSKFDLRLDPFGALFLEEVAR